MALDIERYVITLIAIWLVYAFNACAVTIADIYRNSHRVSTFCQKLKIQKVTPLRFWIGSNGFQKVQKLENLCMLEGALTHIYVYEANSLKRIIRRRCFYLKIRLPLLQMTSTQKIIFKGSSNLQKKFGSKFWHQGPMIYNNLNMAI